MSDSRLEKFIYAICSMDVSDLPVPLSRIETLWNCLITGETPDFEPLSRNEKYLMAMLDRYDISNLPTPMSRGEKLLYKIAVGETDLSDVPGYLSRYEELLKYLIENGGISGGDFEYVLHTLNQSLNTLYLTAEKPVKSAILKGQTLVNLSENLQTITFTLSGWFNDVKLMNNIEKLKRNTYYTILYRLENLSGNHEHYNAIGLGIGMNTFNKDLPGVTYILDKNGGWCKVRFQLTDELIEQNPTYKQLYIRPIRRFEDPVEGESIDYTIKGFTILEGDYITNPIPFNEVFEGMQSVKMPVLTTTGKNLVNSKIEMGCIRSTDGSLYDSNAHIRTKDYIPINPSINNKVTLSNNKGYVGVIFEYDKNYKFIKYTTNNMNGDITVATLDGDCRFIKFRTTDSSNATDLTTLFQLEYGSINSSYEPYKSNILTVNEDVELRGIGDVKDTLDCLTGEVTERIGEITLDGSEDEDWKILGLSGSGLSIGFYISINNKKSVIVKCDKLPLTNYDDIVGIKQGGSESVIQIRMTTEYLTSLDLNSFKIWLAQNPLTIQYKLATESVKTVDLTVVDQDNQPTELGTFENVTHVSLEAENLIPEVEMEVATNLLEDTVFNLTDAFNTLYPTAAKPVKSAILSGQTLVNICKPFEFDIQTTGSGLRHLRDNMNMFNIPLDDNKNYSVWVEIDINEIGAFSISHTGMVANLVFDAIENLTLTGGSVVVYPCVKRKDSLNTNFSIGATAASTAGRLKGRIMVFEGDARGMELSYFEGMQSVKMPVLTTTGKNLFDKEAFYNDWKSKVESYVYKEIVDNEEVLKVNNFYQLFEDDKGFRINVEKGVPLTLRMECKKAGTETTNAVFAIRYGDDKYAAFPICHSDEWKTNTTTFTPTRDYITICSGYNNAGYFYVKNIQVEENSTSTSYEPYKSNILTVNEEVELRGIGEVQDELNLSTGEVTERIGEIVLDGNDDEKWITNTANYGDNTAVFYIGNFFEQSTKVIMDKFIPYIGQNFWASVINDSENHLNNNKDLAVRISKTRLSSIDVNGFRQWLSQNPITIQYTLISESIKTVDLTVVDQDGNETKLRTFDDTTHVLLNSEGLIPTASLTVRTKIPSASSTSLLMDDISTEQQQLNTTVDEQSNNVDATMIATTEIFEETL